VRPRRLRLVLAVIAISALSLTSVRAHHSFAPYETTVQIKLSGVVTSFKWANPHVYFYMDVAGANGAVANWAIEGQAPSVLYRAGFRKDSAKYGDVVTVDGYLARDGSRLVNMARATLADGRSLFVGVQLPPK